MFTHRACLRGQSFGRGLVGIGLCAICYAAGAAGQPASNSFVSQEGTRLTVLLDQRSLGSADVDIGEITFPAGIDSGDHAHGSTEIFYVLSGELEHMVNGKSTMLKPGMIGYVRPPDMVRHRVGPGGPAKALVIWVPGGEAARVVERWQQQK